jgi:predicted metal-dependent hydrolase
MAIYDKEFGEIAVRRSKLARSVKISIGPNGKFRASIPFYAPDFSVKRLVQQNRSELREMLDERNSKNLYQNNQQIGKSHTLIFKNSTLDKIKISTEAQCVVVNIPSSSDPKSIEVQSEIRDYVGKILRKQAKAYLPRRLDFLAQKYDFTYEKIKITHASSRWGSCSSSGTISLNIGLMNLPHELIDYVLIHELCHTRQMNHSDRFWQEVEKYDPSYKNHVLEMKKYNPGI